MGNEQPHGGSEIAALAQRVETARGKLPLQHDPALFDVLSEKEIAAERDLAEWVRAQRRKQRRWSVEDELTTEKRNRRADAAVRRTDAANTRWHRRALAARQRVSSVDARLAQLYRRAEWSSRALIAVVVLGMVWAGVNVQHNLVPSGDKSDPLHWLSYGIEAMISIPIITIMVAATTAARWGRELARGKVVFFETALLATTIALNAGPHLAARSYGRAAEYAIAPMMVGMVIWLHAWVSARYALLIEASPRITDEAQASAATGGAHRHVAQSFPVRETARERETHHLATSTEAYDEAPPQPHRPEPEDSSAEPAHQASSTATVAVSMIVPEADIDTAAGDADEDDGDEISTIAREIVRRRWSKLPVEQLAEILVLADDAWPAAGIAGEVGVPRSAVEATLEAAIKVRRPYAVSG